MTTEEFWGRVKTYKLRVKRQLVPVVGGGCVGYVASQASASFTGPANQLSPVQENLPKLPLGIQDSLLGGFLVPLRGGGIVGLGKVVPSEFVLGLGVPGLRCGLDLRQIWEAILRNAGHEEANVERNQHDPLKS